MISIQEIIHRFEVGDGRRYIPIGTGVLLFIAILAIYNLRESTGYASIEAMDAGQIARNIEQGEGFTTNFIRPLSLALIGEQNKSELDDPMRIKGLHPDISNAPLYPYLLAGAMKVLPFDFTIPALRSKNFRIFQPEVLVGIVNQCLFILCAVVMFFIAKRLFDESIAYFAVAIFLGTDLMWRFSFSGLSTNLAMLFVLMLVAVLLKLESGHPCDDYEEKDNPNRIDRGVLHYIWMGAICGILLGALMMTRYAFICLLVPTILFAVFYLPGKRIVTILPMLFAVVVVVSPWLKRNHDLSGHVLGTAGYAYISESSRYGGTNLERSLQVDIGAPSLREMIRSLLTNGGDILENEIPKLGGSWLSALFLAGLLVTFSNRTLNRLRNYTLLSLLTLGITQALIRTHLSDHSQEINSENLIVLMLPMVYFFGAGLFFLLLDQLRLNFNGAQFYVSILVAVLSCLPLVFRILPPRESPVAYPPYSPPLIQRVGGWFSENELMMSDMPWALGWYADQKCVWVTRTLEPDFFTINDQHKSINGLYLTPITTDGRFVSDMVRDSGWAWGRLHMDITLRKNLPKGFPLLHVDDGFMPDQLVLTDWPRWNSSGK